MGGMFTNTSPETKRVIPANLDGKVKFKIVYVVLESQYQSALTKACNKINEGKEGVAVEAVGYLLEELRNPENLEAFKKDVADANIFIGSLIFVQELADKVVEVLTPERDRLDAVLVFPSMPEVMRLNKVGSFSMTSLGQSKSVIGEFMKKKKKEDGSSFEEGMLKLLRTLPKVLKFLPSNKAKDARSFMMSFQYWLGGSPDNLESMLLMLAKDFVKGAEVSDASIAEPVVIADKGIWHPMAEKVFETYEEYSAWYDDVHCKAAGIDAKNAVTVGLVLQKSHINTKDECHYTAVISELEARGAKVVCIYSGGLDFSGPVEEYFYSSAGRRRVVVDSVINLTGFALVGGPASQDHPKAIETLKGLDVPYICAVPLVFQSFEEWQNSELGLHPIQVALQVSLPEIDGAIEPIIFAGREGATGRSVPLSDRVELLANRALKWASLRKKKNADKKISITVFSFPPDKGNVGTAAYLDVFGSIFAVMKEMKREGYDVGDLPGSAEQLMQSVLNDVNAQIASPELNVAYKMSVPEYEKLCPYAKDLEENWGPAPGHLNTDGKDLLIYGKVMGNVFIGVQPSFGYEGDPMRLLFSKSASPHHGFAAYYTYVDRVFDADAVLHFGTHGSLEFMPGKQVGMSGTCYPDRLISQTPNIYYYAANNPSEATIAKRRSYASTVSYLTPPAENAGLYKGLKDLGELVSSYQNLRENEQRGAAIVNSIVSSAHVQLGQGHQGPADGGRRRQEHDPGATRLGRGQGVPPHHGDRVPPAAHGPAHHRRAPHGRGSHRHLGQHRRHRPPGGRHQVPPPPHRRVPRPRHRAALPLRQRRHLGGRRAAAEGHGGQPRRGPLARGQVDQLRRPCAGAERVHEAVQRLRRPPDGRVGDEEGAHGRRLRQRAGGGVGAPPGLLGVLPAADRGEQRGQRDALRPRGALHHARPWR